MELFADIADLGTIAPLDGGQAADGMRRFRVQTTSSDEEPLSLFTFHVARDKGQTRAGRPGLWPSIPARRGAADRPAAPPPLLRPPRPPRRRPLRRPRPPPRAPPAAPPAEAAATLRVSVDKVDQLINLVGELVITQAMLAENSGRMDTALYQQLAANLADLERNTRDLQQAVMSIRMIPMSVVFSRFPHAARPRPSSARRSTSSPMARRPSSTRAWSRRSPIR